MAEEKEADGEKAAPPKKKLPLLLIGLVLQLLVVLGAGGVMVKVAMFSKRPDQSDGKLRERAIASVRDDSKLIAHYDLKEFQVSLPNNHTLRASIQLEVSDEATSKAIQKRLAAVKSKVLNILSSQSAEKTGSFHGKLHLKDAIREAVNSELISANGDVKGIVRDVFFVEFILM